MELWQQEQIKKFICQGSAKETGGCELVESAFDVASNLHRFIGSIHYYSDVYPKLVMKNSYELSKEYDCHQKSPHLYVYTYRYTDGKTSHTPLRR